jgi:hypothetical protein
MQAGEIGVNVTINGKVASGTNDSAFVGSAMQVSDDGLDGSGVTLLWAVVEACNLTDSEGDVGSSVRREIEEHSNDGRIAPGLIVRFTVRIDAEWELDSWRPIRVAVSHSSCINDSLDQSFLSESDGVVRSVLNEFNAKEISKRALLCEL